MISRNKGIGAQLEMTWNMHAKLEMNWTRGSNLFAVHKKHVQNKYDFWEEYRRRRIGIQNANENNAMVPRHHCNDDNNDDDYNNN